MFEMLDELDHENGSEARYYARQNHYAANFVPLRRHKFWWLVHNVVAHPAIGILPCSYTFRFHDWTSGKINLRD